MFDIIILYILAKSAQCFAQIIDKDSISNY